MKKIIGILLAGALVTSAFAADVSAKVKLTGDIVNWDGKAINALKLNNHVSHNWEPDLALSVSNDNAGATIKFKTLNEWGNGEGETSTSWQIWLKPIDMLKITVGSDVDVNLNQEHIDWSNTKSGWNCGEGYKFSVNVGAIDIDLGFLPGFGKNWLAANGVNNATRIGDTGLKIAFNSDFGTIAGLFEYNGQNTVKEDILTGTMEYKLDATNGQIVGTQKKESKAKYDYNYMKFGLGYNSGSLLDGINVFVNVLGAVNSDGLDVKTAKFNNGFSAIRAEVYAEMHFDAIGIFLFPAINVSTVAADTDKISVFTTLKFNYGLSNGMNIFVYFKANNWLKIEKDGLLAKLGLSGSVGVCGWEIRAEATFAKKDAPFALAVPVELTVNF